ncbi:MAG TPA: excinuclease ATPase subunit [Ramlibacter sp.]|nr:excinuclease ATPase subunit [Ramlibacter sp.]
MKKTILSTLLATGLALAALPCLAADTEYHLPFAELLESADAKQKLDGSVRFYLQGQKTPKVLEKQGDDVSNKKTNAFGKQAQATCQWAALSALIALQDKAKRVGANAVVNIVSFYKRDPFVSATEYECHVGNLMTGVALKGTMAKVAP